MTMWKMIYMNRMNSSTPLVRVLNPLDLRHCSDHDTDEYMLQQPVHNRHYQASRGLARLSLAPALLKSYQDQSIEIQHPQPRMQTQPMNKITNGRRGMLWTLVRSDMR